jgi:hypothetical protein
MHWNVGHEQHVPNLPGYERGNLQPQKRALPAKNHTKNRPIHQKACFRQAIFKQINFILLKRYFRFQTLYIVLTYKKNAIYSL